LPHALDDPFLAGALGVAQAATRDEFGNLHEDCIRDPRYSIRLDHHAHFFLGFFSRGGPHFLKKTVLEAPRKNSKKRIFL
jgi:hypothetical protein